MWFQSLGWRFASICRHHHFRCVHARMRALVRVHARARVRVRVRTCARVHACACARGTHVLKYTKMDITAREIARVVISRQHILQKYLLVYVRRLPNVCES